MQLLFENVISRLSQDINYFSLEYMANVLICHFLAGGKCPGGNMSVPHISFTLKFDSAAIVSCLHVGILSFFVYYSQRKSVYFCRTLMGHLTFNTHAAVNESMINMFCLHIIFMTFSVQQCR